LENRSELGEVRGENLVAPFFRTWSSLPSPWHSNDQRQRSSAASPRR